MSAWNCLSGPPIGIEACKSIIHGSLNMHDCLWILSISIAFQRMYHFVMQSKQRYSINQRSKNHQLFLSILHSCTAQCVRTTSSNLRSTQSHHRNQVMNETKVMIEAIEIRVILVFGIITKALSDLLLPQLVRLRTNGEQITYFATCEDVP